MDGALVLTSLGGGAIPAGARIGWRIRGGDSGFAALGADMGAGASFLLADMLAAEGTCMAKVL